MEVVPRPLLSYPWPWGLSTWGAQFSLPNSWPWQLKSLKCCNHEIREDDFFTPSHHLQDPFPPSREE